MKCSTSLATTNILTKINCTENPHYPIQNGYYQGGKSSKHVKDSGDGESIYVSGKNIIYLKIELSHTPGRPLLGINQNKFNHLL